MKQLVLIVSIFILLPFAFGIPYLAVDDYGRAKFSIPRRPSAMPVPRGRAALDAQRALDKRVDAFEHWLPHQLMVALAVTGLVALGFVLPVFNAILAIRSTRNPILAVRRGVEWFLGGWFIFGWFAAPIAVGIGMLANEAVGSFAKMLGFSP